MTPGDVIEFTPDGAAKRAGRVPVGGVMYDDSGAIVSEVVLKDRIHMSNEGMFVVVLTVGKGSGAPAYQSRHHLSWVHLPA